VVICSRNLLRPHGVSLWRREGRQVPARRLEAVRLRRKECIPQRRAWLVRFTFGQQVSDMTVFFSLARPITLQNASLDMGVGTLHSCTALVSSNQKS
jgi:hypothetical protein